MTKGALHIFEISEDVGVIELKIVEYRDLWAVVDKLATLIEEGLVILVAFNDESFALP